MVVSKYERAITPHIEWFKEQIKKSNDGIIRVSIKNLRSEMGKEFSDTNAKTRIHDTTIYTRLKDILLENGIKVTMGHIENRDKLLLMTFAKEEEIASAADTRYLRAIKTAEKQGLTFAEYDKRCDHKTYGALSQEDNESCALYFGEYIEKKYVSQIFEDPIPFEFPKDELGRITDKRKPYDYICKRGLKIKMVASCLRRKSSDNTEVAVGSVREYWQWLIRRNCVPDYWILSGWNDRESLEPMYIWIIEKDERIANQEVERKNLSFYDRDSFVVYFNEKGIKKMKKYEVTDKLDKLKEVCSIAKDKE